MPVHQMVPALVRQRSIRAELATGEFTSTIVENRVRDKSAARSYRLPLGKKLVREIRRPFASFLRRSRLRLGPSKGIVRRIRFR